MKVSRPELRAESANATESDLIQFLTSQLEALPPLDQPAPPHLAASLRLAADFSSSLPSTLRPSSPAPSRPAHPLQSAQTAAPAREFKRKIRFRLFLQAVASKCVCLKGQFRGIWEFFKGYT
jgi:hypothetical protein